MTDTEGLEVVRSIADQVNKDDLRGLTWPELRQAVVTAVDETVGPVTATVLLSGEEDTDNVVDLVPCLILPSVNDTVFVLRNGTDLIIAGALQTSLVKQARVPRCKAYRGTNISVSDNTLTVINFTAEVFDSHAMHDTAVNPSRFTPSKAGLYWCTATVNWDTNASGQRLVQLLKNGATAIAEISGPPLASAVTAQQASSLVPFNGTTDYIEMRVRQVSGAALLVMGGSEHQTSFNMFWIADDAVSA